MTLGGDPHCSGACILFTASSFKTTRGESLKQFAIPLHDYRGRSLLTAAMDPRDQMGGERGGFLRAASNDPADIDSDLRHDDEGHPKAGSYSASTQLMRQFVTNFGSSSFRTTLPTSLRRNTT